MTDHSQQQQIFQLQPVPPQNKTPTKDTTEFLHHYTAGALLHLTQSVITGVLTFIVTLSIFWLLFPLMLDIYKPALALGVITTLGTWIMRQRLWIHLATQQLERMTGIDLDNDGKIAGEEEDEPQHDHLRITLSKIGKDDHYSSKSFNIPVTREQLASLAHGLLQLHQPFTEKIWTGAGNPFSINQFRELRSVMKVQGLIELINESEPRQGLRLTEEGELWLENYLVSSPPPSVEVGEIV